MEILADSRKNRRRYHAAAGSAWITAALISSLLWFIVDGPIAAGFVVAFGVVSVGYALRHLHSPGGWVVLVYHSISEDQGWLPWSGQIAMTPESFDRQLAMLKDKGFDIISTRDFLRRRREGSAGSADTVVIHLDDGYLDNWVAAAPILRRHGAPATLFVSLDFIAGGNACRPTIEQVRKRELQSKELEWQGYMNWPEIASLDSSDLFDIQPHGVDHGRVPVSARTVAIVGPTNWRDLAWIQWRNMRGNKSEWWRAQSPPATPYCTPVPESAPAFSARAWLGDRLETPEEYTARVRSELLQCKRVFSERLGKEPEIFCWPENGTSVPARVVAADLGFIATTAGAGENRQDDPIAEISRLHVKERVLGFPSMRADLIYLYASVRCFQGRYYWYFVMLPMQAVSMLVSLVKHVQSGQARFRRDEAPERMDARWRASKSAGNRAQDKCGEWP